jgi:hypothetical protein
MFPSDRFPALGDCALLQKVELDAAAFAAGSASSAETALEMLGEDSIYAQQEASKRNQRIQLTQVLLLQWIRARAYDSLAYERYSAYTNGHEDHSNHLAATWSLTLTEFACLFITGLVLDNS